MLDLRILLSEKLSIKELKSLSNYNASLHKDYHDLIRLSFDSFSFNEKRTFIRYCRNYLYIIKDMSSALKKFADEQGHFSYLSEECQDHDACIYYLNKSNGNGIRLIKNQTEEMCNLAVKLCYTNIQYIKDQSKFYYKMEEDPRTIEHFRIKTPELFLRALKLSKDNRFDIKSANVFTDEVIDFICYNKPNLIVTLLNGEYADTFSEKNIMKMFRMDPIIINHVHTSSRRTVAFSLNQTDIDSILDHKSKIKLERVICYNYLIFKNMTSSQKVKAIINENINDSYILHLNKQELATYYNLLLFK